jgi:peroxiredoxin
MLDVASFENLPTGLPVPTDDGRAAHLVGSRLPHIELLGSSGRQWDLAGVAGTVVIYVYPMTGTPGVALPSGWDSIPGARGCTPEACGFRDHYSDLLAAGASVVVGVSSQSTEHQREAAERLHLPFDLLSDHTFEWAAALNLPTFTADGVRFHSRLTLIATTGTIEHVFYPVFPPDTHADQVLAWLGQNMVT